MAYCRICDVRKVSREGEVCPTCKADGYADEFVVSDADETRETEVIDSIPQQDSSNANHFKPNTQFDNSNSTTVIRRGRRPQQAPVVNNTSSVVTQPVVSQPVYVPAQDEDDNKNQEKTNGALTEGVVRNIQKKKDIRGPIGKWFYCFFNGISFTSSPEMMEFQVYVNWNNTSNASGYSADKVIVYGNMEAGEPINDNSVRVYGKKLNNNFIVAEQIENTTDGTFTQFNPAHIPAMMVRFVTVSVLALLGYVLYSIGNMMGNAGTAISSGASGAFSTAVNNIPEILTAVIFVVGGSIFTFQSVKKAWRNLTMGNWSDFGFNAIMALIGLAVVKAFLPF